jgi:hypothetical protein
MIDVLETLKDFAKRKEPLPNRVLERIVSANDGILLIQQDADGCAQRYRELISQFEKVL